MKMIKLCLIIRLDWWNHPVAPIPPAMQGHGHPGCQDRTSFQPQYSGVYHRLSGCNYAGSRRRMVDPVLRGSCQTPTIGGGIHNKRSRKVWQNCPWKSGDDKQICTAETHQTHLEQNYPVIDHSRCSNIIIFCVLHGSNMKLTGK